MAAAQEEPDRPELSPEELEAYARDGFLVRRGFLDEGQLDQLGGPVFRAYRDHSYPETEAYPQHGAALHLGSRILADHPSMAALSLDHPSIVRIVEQILGERAVFSLYTMYMRGCPARGCRRTRTGRRRGTAPCTTTTARTARSAPCWTGCS